MLVFTKTLGHHHDSIPRAVATIKQLGVDNGFGVDQTSDSSVFSDSGLLPYSAVIFALTTRNVLNGQEQAAFERFIQSGKGFAGIHSATDTEYDWSWYGGLVGAYYQTHSGGQMATLKVFDHSHASTSHLGDTWDLYDEWYNFTVRLRGSVHVLLGLDESTYPGGTMGSDHPISWCHGFDGGRSWYTGMGHVDWNWSDPAFQQHVLGGIKYAAQGDAKRDCGGTVSDNFDRTILDGSGVVQPTSVAPAADGRVFYTQKAGLVKVWRPSSGTTVSATLTVDSSFEHGLSGLALDPGFATNGYVYMVYTHSSGTNRVSRFKATGDLIDTASETVLLSYSVLPQCCHHTGRLQFGLDGLLYISTGDGTSPDPSGYTPIDERAGRSGYDAQRTSANTASFEGKILRILPQPNGTYTIPPGNLFAAGSGGLPEIFAMGLRDPGRVSIDSKTGWSYVADPGPNAASDSATRGPRGYEEVEQIREAGNLGWPYCIAGNLAYRDYDFSLASTGLPFDCASPQNGSPNNTGQVALPAARSSLIAYGNTSDAVLGVGARSLMAGPLYRFDPSSVSATKFPEYFDGALFIADNEREWLKEMRFDSSGMVQVIHPFLTGVASTIVDISQGSDGSLYLLDQGPDPADPNTPGAALRKISYNVAADMPVPVTDKSGPRAGPGPLTVNLSAEGSHDPDPGDSLTYGWDFTSDGTIDSTTMVATHTYPQGFAKATLKVTDSTGRSRVAFVNILSGVLANSPVVAVDQTSPTSGIAPLTVNFSSVGSYDPDGDTFDYLWDFEDDGVIDSLEPNPSHTFAAGAYTPRLSLIDTTGRSASATLSIISGNTRPVVSFDSPADGMIHHFGDAVSYRVRVTDAQDGATDDGSISCSSVIVSLSLSHDSHMHPLQQQGGCEGQLVSNSSEHDPNKNSLGVVLTGSYTDHGGPQYGPIIGSGEAMLNPFRKQAEAFTSASAVTKRSLGGGRTVAADIHSGDWIRYRPMNLEGIELIGFRVATWYSGGIIEVRTSSRFGPIIARVAVPNTSLTTPYQYREVFTPIENPGGTVDLYLTFKSYVPGSTPVGIADATVELFSIDWIDFLRSSDPLPSPA